MTVAPAVKSIVFVHPDLGLGGAEQLVVQAALGVQSIPIEPHSITYAQVKAAFKQGDLSIITTPERLKEIRKRSSLKREVEIVTAHHDRSRAFRPTIDGSLKVSVYGSWLPRTILGECHALCAILRMFWIFLVLLCRCLQQGMRRYDAIMVDQVSAINPLFWLLTKRLVFYCHYPDLLLCVDREGAVKKAYRAFVDWLEAATIGCCDALIVNSKFTANVVRRTFPSLKKRPLTVLHPPIDVMEVDRSIAAVEDCEEAFKEYRHLRQALKHKQFVVSINRYERKKNIALAINAVHWVAEMLKRREMNVIDDIQCPLLVIAGGYDPRLPENKEVFLELKNLAKRRGLEEGTQVFFLQSISDKLRWALLYHALAVIYTPKNEHFGIVPVEAMAVGTPAVVSNTGGPTESVVDGVTGYHCEDTAESFGSKILRLADWEMARKYTEYPAPMEEACRQRARECFSLDNFARSLLTIMEP